MSNDRGVQRECKTRRSGTADLKILVAEYRKEHQRHAVKERRMFEQMPSLDLAIHHAALAVDDQGRCFDHQFRIRRPARREAKQVLLAARKTIKASRSFEELHRQLNELLSPIRGIGEMYVYDAAVRLGAFLHLRPDCVYLHAGTREGARNLGLNVSKPYLELKDLPKELRGMTADDVETFLCVFKTHVGAPGE